MHTQHRSQIRAFNARGVLPARVSGAAEPRARRIRGYDSLGALLFTMTASTSPREGVRSSMDRHAIRQKIEKFGARLVRCEVDALSGAVDNLTIRSDGTIKDAYLVHGKLVSM